MINNSVNAQTITLNMLPPPGYGRGYPHLGQTSKPSISLRKKVVNQRRTDLDSLRSSLETNIKSSQTKTKTLQESAKHRRMQASTEFSQS